MAASAETMVELAVSMAQDPDTPSRLAELRRSMRERLARSSACDAAALAQGMEQLYRNAWDEQRESRRLT